MDCKRLDGLNAPVKQEAQEMLARAEALAPHIAEITKRRATADAKLKVPPFNSVVKCVVTLNGM